MSITDELRKVAAKTECANGRCEKLYRGDLDHIADRIDEQVRREYIELPKDADGKVICVGDEVEYLDEPHVCRVVTSIDLAHDGWWVYVGGMGRRPDKYRHYHRPTVEDVLDEFFGKANLPDGTQTRAEIIAEYAAKLRLAGEE